MTLVTVINGMKKGVFHPRVLCHYPPTSPEENKKTFCRGSGGAVGKVKDLLQTSQKTGIQKSIRFHCKCSWHFDMVN